jgi:hypothetical protein
MSIVKVETKDTGFATKCENLFACILACARQLQKKSYGRLCADYQAIIGRLPII